MSQLAAQLNVLSGGFKTDARRLGSRPSFLFTAAQAADVDIDTVFALGVNGLTELRALDERFAAFEATLFSAARGAGHSSFDRNMQSKEANEKLDQSIASFLRLMSPHFLHNASHKVLEFFIRRYQVHDHNVDALLECSLPYHETNYFARLVQLLKLPMNGRWEFLQTAQKAGAPLSRITLVQRCCIDTSLLTFLAELAHRQAELSARSSSVAPKSAIALFAVVTLESLTQIASSSTTESLSALVRTLAPHIINALSFGGNRCVEYQTAGYMLLAQLSALRQLDVSFVHAALQALTRSIDAEAASVAALSKPLLCVISVCQSQNLATLSRKTLSSLSRCVNLLPALADISTSSDISAFYQLLLVSAVQHRICDASIGNMLSAAVDQVKLLSAVVRTVAVALFQDYLSRASLKNAEAERQAKAAKGRRESTDAPADQSTVHESATIALLRRIERRFPIDLDTSLDTVLKSTTDNDQRTRLFQLINSIFDRTGHQIMEESGTTLFFSLEHASINVRTSAFERLRTLLNRQDKMKDEEKMDDATVTSILEQRLNEQNARLLAQILALPALLTYVDHEILLGRVISCFDAFIPHLSHTHPQLALVAAARTDEVIVEKDARAVVGASVGLAAQLLAKSASTEGDKKSLQRNFASASLHRILPYLLALMPLHGNSGKFFDVIYRSIVAAGSAHPLFSAILPLVEKLSGDSESLAVAELNTKLVSLQAAAFGSMDAQSASVVVRACSDAPHRVGANLVLAAAAAALKTSKSLSGDLDVLSAVSDLACKELACAAVVESDSHNPLAPQNQSSVAAAALLCVIEVASKLSNNASLQSRIFEFLSAPNLASAPTAVHFRALLQQHTSTSNASFVPWLANFWTSSDSAAAAVRALHLTHAHLECGTESASLIVALVLPALAHSSRAVRHAACLCLSAVPSSTEFESLRSALVNKREECVADGAVAARVSAAVCIKSDSLIDAVLNHARMVLTTLTVDSDSLASQTVESLLTFVAAAHSAKASTLCAELRLLFTLVTSLDQPAKKGKADAVYDFSSVAQTSLSGARARACQLLLRRMNASTLVLLGADQSPFSSASALQCLLSLLKSTVQLQTSEKVSLASQAAALFSAELYSALKAQKGSGVQSLLRTTVEVLGKSHADAQLCSVLRVQLGSWSMDVDALVSIWPESAAVQAIGAAGLNITEESLRPLTVALELLLLRVRADSVETKGDLRRLLALCFDALEALTSSAKVKPTDAQQTVVASIAYALQVVLDCAASLCARIAAATESSARDVSKSIRLPALVLCIGSSALGSVHAQTRSHALRLLAALAPLAPSAVLDAVLPVFTAATEAEADIGDDDYTFSVMQQTLESVLPAVMSASSTAFSVSSLLNVFIDALPRIPSAKRLPLFVALIRSMASADGSLFVQQCSEYVHATCALLLLRGTQTGRVFHTFAPSRRQNAAAEPINLESTAVVVTDVSSGSSLFYGDFAHLLAFEFDVHVQMRAAARLAALIGEAGVTTAAENSVLQSLTVDDDVSDDENMEDMEEIDLIEDDGQSAFTSLQTLSANHALSVVQRAVFAQHVADFLVAHMPNARLLTKLVAANHSVAARGQLQRVYLRLFGLLFLHLKRLNEAEGMKTSEEQSAGLNRALKTLATKVDAALVHVNALLETRGFLRATDALLSHADQRVRRKAAQLLHEKCIASMSSAQVGGIKVADIEHFVALVPRLLELIQTALSSSDRDNCMTVQTCLLAIDSMSSALLPRVKSDESESIDTFCNALPQLVVCLNHTQRAVQSSALLCLASLVKSLQANSVAHFPAFFPPVLNALERSTAALRRDVSLTAKKAKLATAAEDDASDDAGAALVVDSALTALETVVTVLPQFISAQLGACLRALLNPTLLARRVSMTGSVSVVQATLSAIAERVPARLLLPALFSCYRQCLSSGVQSAVALFDFLAQTCSHLSRDDARQHHKTVFKFFLVAFDMRRSAGARLASMTAVEQIEQSIVRAFMALVVKLNEAQLKPLLLKLIEWVGLTGTSGDDDEPAAPVIAAASMSAHDPCRAIMLFRCVDALVDRLRALFVPYAVYFTEHASAYLRLSGADKEERLARTEQLPVVPPSDSESFHSLVGSAQSSTAALMVAAAADSPVASKKRKHANSDSDPLDAAALRALLASLVVSALSKLFEFDSSSSDAQFLDEDRFENLLPSLCEQVELAAADRSPSEYTLFVESSLMPAFVSLAVRVNAEAQWKALNSALLLRTRHSSPHVRFGALRCVAALFVRLGLPYLALLPETVPFVAELMEDDNIEVERLCQALIRQIEALSGESMENYLR